MEIKNTDASGKEVVSANATVSSIKTRARLALEFVANLDKNGDDEQLKFRGGDKRKGSNLWHL